MSQPNDPMEILNSLGAEISPALTRPGPLRITARDCVMCGPDMDCICHTIEFGSPEYFARLDRLHGKASRENDSGYDPRWHGSEITAAGRVNFTDQVSAYPDEICGTCGHPFTSHSFYGETRSECHEGECDCTYYTGTSQSA